MGHHPDMDGLEIRRMRDNELDETVAVWVRARWDAMPELEGRMGYDDAQNGAFFRDVVVREEQVWVAVAGGRVQGLLTLRGAEIERLYVDPPAQRRGVGSALLARARELSPGRLSLYTHRRNERARRFYERHGFAAVAFGTSPAPESEPDVRYEWRPADAAH